MSAQPTYGDDPLGTGLDPDLVIPARIADWAAREPDRPFMTEVGGRSVTYGEFYDELLRWCEYLRGLGIGPGDRVGSFLPASVDAQLLWLSLSCIGAYEVPVNPELRGELLRHVLVDSGASICFARPDNAHVPADSGVPVHVITVPRGASFVGDFTPKPLDRFPSPADVCCVIYTSGTTGPSKGAVIPWGQYNAILGRTPRAWFRGDDVVYAPQPMFHVTGRTPTITMSDVGGRIVYREKLSINEFWNDIRAYGCTSTTVHGAPLILALPERPDDRDNPLRLGQFGVLGPVAIEFSRRFDVQLVSNYGSTEIGFPFTNRDVSEQTMHIAGWLRPGYEAKVVDPEDPDGRDGRDGRDLGFEKPGELCIKPPHPHLMMLGYLNHPELTAKVIRDGWYHTGDGAILQADGGLRFLDRLRDTIRRFGENISSTALETIINVDAGVAECAVIGVPSQVAGHEVLLVVRPIEAAVFDPATLYRRLTHELPKHCLPAYISMREDEFPKTPNGKIRKVALKDELERVERGDTWTTPSAVSQHHAFRNA